MSKPEEQAETAETGEKSHHSGESQSSDDETENMTTDEPNKMVRIVPKPSLDDMSFMSSGTTSDEDFIVVPDKYEEESSESEDDCQHHGESQSSDDETLTTDDPNKMVRIVPKPSLDGISFMSSGTTSDEDFIIVPDKYEEESLESEDDCQHHGESQSSDDETLTTDDPNKMVRIVPKPSLDGISFMSSGTTSDEDFIIVPDKYESGSSGREDECKHHSGESQSSDDEKLIIDEPKNIVRIAPKRTLDDISFMSSRTTSDEDFMTVPDKYEAESSGREYDCKIRYLPNYLTNTCSDEPSCSRITKKPKYDLNPAEFEVNVVQPNKMDNKGQLLLQKMGYKSGTGLGKHAQGRIEQIELSKQIGRRGLGVSIPGLDPAKIQWNPDTDVFKAKEDILWLNGSHLKPLDESTLSKWKHTGLRDTNIENMTDFCNDALLKKILEGKSAFEQIPERELFRARSRSNPFEALKNSIFLNMAALKMANMDAAFDFMFTNPKYPNGVPMVGDKDLLYFADVCAGPGGFSEYILWKKKWKAKGIGFTLKGENDFKFSKFSAGCPLSFEPYYGKYNDGNVFNPENITSLTEFVMSVTDHVGVHFMMADGGFSVKGQENIQEILSKQLYLCQCLVALSIVRTNGHFVCKLFDIFSPFSAGIVYLMYRSFKSISIFKPNSSRPANSERYIICKHKRRDCDAIREYMYKINKELFEMGPKSKTDITGIVSMSQLKSDKNFYNYLVASNYNFGERQVVNLLKIKSYCQDQNLFETRQKEMREECLKLWKIPNQATRCTDRLTPDEVVNKILYNPKDNLSFNIQPLVSEIFEKAFKGIYDWQCFALSTTEPKFYLGVSRSMVYQWNSKRLTWDRVTECDVKLNPGTLIYGEIIHEIQGEFKNQKKIKALHAIDGISLGYEIIYKLPFHERLIVRCSRMCQTQFVIEEEEYCYEPKAVLFINTTKPPWIKNVSKSNKNAPYYFHTYKKVSYFEKDCDDKDVYENTLDSLKKSLLWIWEQGVGLKKEDPCKGIVHKDHLMEFINKFI